MGVVVEFPIRPAKRHLTFSAAARAALVTLEYLVPDAIVRFGTSQKGQDFAIIGGVWTDPKWFAVHPSLNGKLVVRDGNDRVVGRYKTGDELRDDLRPLLNNLALLCSQQASSLGHPA